MHASRTAQRGVRCARGLHVAALIRPVPPVHVRGSHAPTGSAHTPQAHHGRPFHDNGEGSIRNSRDLAWPSRHAVLQTVCYAATLSQEPSPGIDDEDEDEDAEDEDDLPDLEDDNTELYGEDEGLSAEQLRVLELVRAGCNVYYTGKAGTGKTFLVKRIVQELQSLYPGKEYNKRVAITAMTGLAATHVNGTTLHSALGLKMPQYERDFDSMLHGSASDAVMDLRVLLVDEVSMLAGEMWELIEERLRRLRDNGMPAGGLQVIMCGDFYQLPPVVEKRRMVEMVETSVTGKATPKPFYNWGWAWQSPAWLRCRFEHVVLTQAFRQKDERFVKLLDDIRTGNNAQAALTALHTACARPLPILEGIQPTRLLPMRRAVDEFNAIRLAQLPTDTVSFDAMDSVEVLPEILATKDKRLIREATKRLSESAFYENCQAVGRVNLKVGAQVMLVFNVDNRAGLVNGSVGKVLDVRYGDDGSPTCKVLFSNGKEADIGYHKFECQAPDGTCMRRQIPLKLAWALTIHKSQGMTLDQVQVCLSDVFTEGMAYVALSRVRTMEGLQILSLPRRKIMTDQNVGLLYQAMSAGEDAVDRHLQGVQADWDREMKRRSTGTALPRGDRKTTTKD